MSQHESQTQGRPTDDDALAEVQAAIDHLIQLAWVRWGEAAPIQTDDVRDALVDVRLVVRELDGLWLHLRAGLGR